MKLIDIQETEKTPNIFLDDEKNIFEMSGRKYFVQKCDRCGMERRKLIKEWQSRQL